MIKIGVFPVSYRISLIIKKQLNSLLKPIWPLHTFLKLLLEHMQVKSLENIKSIVFSAT